VTWWVYVIECGDFAKIGMSNNVARRLKQLRTQSIRPRNAHLSELRWAGACDSSTVARGVESAIKEMYREVAVRKTREWFPQSQVHFTSLIAAAEALIPICNKLDSPSWVEVANRVDNLKYPHERSGLSLCQTSWRRYLLDTLRPLYSRDYKGVRL